MRDYSMLKWIFNEQNGGFAYAMNQGLKVASGDVLVIMNPDVKLGKGVDRMYAYLMQNDSIGVIAPQIKNVQGVIQDSFRRFITPMNFVCRHLHRMLGMERVEIALNIQSVDWVIGAFMMIPRQAYEVVGGLDAHYFCIARIWICARECIWQDILLFIFQRQKLSMRGHDRQDIL